MSDQTTSIMQRLRSETSDLHSHAESRVLQQEIAKGEVDRSHFVAYLAQLHHAHEALESALEAARDHHPAIAVLATPDRMRIPDLDRDLEFYGVDIEGVQPAEATTRFTELVDATSQSNPVALLGALYVLEGSTNGGRFLAKALRRSWDLGAEGLAYFDPYGDDQTKQWSAFKTEMDRSVFDESQRDAMVSMARSTFEAIAEISDEVATTGGAVELSA
jgi:heme oxygenase